MFERLINGKLDKIIQLQNIKKKIRKKNITVVQLKKSSKKKRKSKSRKKNLEFCSRFLISVGFVTHPKIDKKNPLITVYPFIKKYQKSHFQGFNILSLLQADFFTIYQQKR